MKYRDLNIQTQREAPNNARTEGFAFLVRAGYLTRENVPTQLGEYTLKHLRTLFGDPSSLSYSFERLIESLSLPTIGNKNEVFFAIPSGSTEVAYCQACGYTERLELAHFAKLTSPPEEQLPVKKVSTPDCHTIEALAAFLGVPKEKTATAEEIERSGAVPGYASPIGLRDALIAVDDLIPHMQNLVAGANETGYHLK